MQNEILKLNESFKFKGFDISTNTDIDIDNEILNKINSLSNNEKLKNERIKLLRSIKQLNNLPCEI